jgi:hypothetical protein
MWVIKKSIHNDDVKKHEFHYYKNGTNSKRIYPIKNHSDPFCLKPTSWQNGQPSTEGKGYLGNRVASRNPNANGMDLERMRGNANV